MAGLGFNSWSPHAFPDFSSCLPLTYNKNKSTPIHLQATAHPLPSLWDLIGPSEAYLLVPTSAAHHSLYISVPHCALLAIPCPWLQFNALVLKHIHLITISMRNLVTLTHAPNCTPLSMQKIKYYNTASILHTDS